MCKLTIIRGLPGSGKSTLARRLSAAAGGIMHVDEDMLMMQDGAHMFTHAKVEPAKDALIDILQEMAYAGADLIVSGVFPSETDVLDLVDNWYCENILFLQKHPGMTQSCSIIDLRISAEESFKRNKHMVPMEDIDTMDAAWTPASDIDALDKRKDLQIQSFDVRNIQDSADADADLVFIPLPQPPPNI